MSSRRYDACIQFVQEPEAVAAIYREPIDEVGYPKAGRRMGNRINVSRPPRPDEPAEAARRDSLATTYLDVDGIR